MNDKKRIIKDIQERKCKCLKSNLAAASSAYRFSQEINQLEQLIKNIEKIEKELEKGNKPKGRISQYDDDIQAEKYEIKYLTLKELDSTLKKEGHNLLCLNYNDDLFRYRRNRKKHVNIFQGSSGKTAIFYISIRKYFV